MMSNYRALLAAAVDLVLVFAPIFLFLFLHARDLRDDEAFPIVMDLGNSALEQINLERKNAIIHAASVVEPDQLQLKRTFDDAFGESLEEP
ncbi:hypothetical protein SCHPADRAFT_720894 [Schizopora paradoxa]|uniref:Uncharacterized protein n=1 Tax=Schizopora paradoxa TaxID=27342 RepID=A0A0H2R2K3_9AGAM|nr:hypothetical protein SCHPADRAFT_720894 [Schizopora paradoxa]